VKGEGTIVIHKRSLQKIQCVVERLGGRHGPSASKQILFRLTSMLLTCTRSESKYSINSEYSETPLTRSQWEVHRQKRAVCVCTC